MSEQAVTLVATIHDRDDSQLAQALRVLPVMRQLYHRIVVLTSPPTTERTASALEDAGVLIEPQRGPKGGVDTLGLVRLDTLRHGLQTEASHLHFCDWDRLIHWAEFWPDELATIVAAIPTYDFLILGRTARAFASHPQVQRDTERLINHVFGLAWGQPLDITAASRGLSRRAAHFLIANCPEPSLGNDGAWPLCLAAAPDLVIGYATTEGLEWETPDRHRDEIELMGGLDVWIAHFDANLSQWVERTRLAHLEVEAIQRWRLNSSASASNAEE